MCEWLKRMYVPLVALSGCIVIGCSGSSGDADIGSDALTKQYMRLIISGDGSEFLCEFVDLPSPGPYECVKKGTLDKYICKIFDDGSGKTIYNCVTETNSGSWSPPCENYRQFGDYKDGLQCWDPPDNYCKDGCGPAITWFCKQDATKCCRIGCTCFRCGWIEIDPFGGCKVAGDLHPSDASTCEEFKAELPEQYMDCISSGSCQDQGIMQQILDDPECTPPDSSLIICK